LHVAIVVVEMFQNALLDAATPAQVRHNQVGRVARYDAHEYGDSSYIDDACSESYDGEHENSATDHAVEQA